MQFAKAQRETIMREKDNPPVYGHAYKIIIKFHRHKNVNLRQNLERYVSQFISP